MSDTVESCVTCDEPFCVECDEDAQRCVAGGWHCSDCMDEPCGPCDDQQRRDDAADRELAYLRGK